MKAYPMYELTQVTSLRHLIDLRAEENPNGTAFFFTGDDGSVKTVSYSRFRDDVAACATYFMSQGYRDGAHIALLGVNSYEWLVTFFAVCNSGNVILPMDARQPVENTMKLLVSGDCTTLVYSKEFAPAIPAFAANIPGFRGFPMTEAASWIAEGEKLIAAGDHSFADYELDVDRMCALVFTSGTTGVPKGVMLSQKNIASNINQACGNYRLEGPGLSPLPMHHMFGLVVGHLMVFNYNKPCYIVTNMRNIMRDMQIAKPRCLFVVPMIIETFAKQFRNLGKRAGGQLTPEMVKGFCGGDLCDIICGGAPLMPMYVQMFRQFGINLLNGYGITECSPVLAVNRVYDYLDGSVGPVLHGCEVRIDEDGEILVRGDNVMLGYYKMEKETEEAFKGGWFHTGDIGRIDDHYLFITGRTKNLIITSSGENVSPEELEDKLLTDPAVAEAIVYEKDNVLAVQIYPEPEAHAPEEYFKALLDKVNKGEPVYRQMKKLIVRTEPFTRNSTGKIIRALIK